MSVYLSNILILANVSIESLLNNMEIAIYNTYIWHWTSRYLFVLIFLSCTDNNSGKESKNKLVFEKYAI